MTTRKTKKRKAVAALPARKPTALLTDVRELILQAREGVARAVDSGLTTLYWHMGRRKLAVKVVDIFGNDTMTIVEVSVGGKK